MRKTLNILSTSFRMAMDELRKNRLRSFLSLFGITIGIFCIVAVLATVNSLDSTVHEELKAMGTNTVFVQKWPWGGGADYPWWKYLSRPTPKYEELRFIKERADYAAHAAIFFNGQTNLEYGDFALTNVNWYGVTEEFNLIQNVDVGYGRFILPSEFQYGTPVAVMGYTTAEKLFDDPPTAVGKTIEIKGHKVLIVGVIRKQGNSLIGGWDFDNVVVIPYQFCTSFANVHNQDMAILVRGKEGIPLDEVKGQLRGVMRAVRRLSPKQDDNFALNDVTSGTSELNSIFGGMTLGGFAITILSFIVGIFGVANIMFVTVRERTPMIGLKKAIGAKRRTILLEFLLESAFLCVLGGVIGLILVFLLTFLLSSVVHFTVSISFGLFLGSVLFCIFTGMLAGIIPASIAARMDPVKAIRS
ncbi:ABC transporter permease [Dinghuibacter silviterrae]|uniref:Putative ABC transport system permease protein n=1 Tax=Dinghuibacter silviterrae TaxID=1539049 RepID=A0A4R8DGI2_9BACT|nr:ABC transporter permease [Dinghuibacter silviterrae]TDW96557.1 putative ABC transport system permease protein [Dinghuibacter silviterrae]